MTDSVSIVNTMQTIFYIFGCTLCGLAWLAAMSLLFTIIGWIFS